MVRGTQRSYTFVAFLFSGFLFFVSNAHALTPLKQLIRYNDFAALLQFNASRVPELQGFWTPQFSNITWGGSSLRGFIHWHFIQLQTHTPEQIRQMHIPSLMNLASKGGKDFDFFGPTSSQKAVRKKLKNIKNLDFIDEDSYKNFIKLGGASIEKLTLSPYEISDPYKGLRDYYEGRSVFIESKVPEKPSPKYLKWLEENDYSNTASALRFLRLAFFNLPEASPSPLSKEKIRNLYTQDELKFLSNEGRLAWLEICVEKLLLAAQWNMPKLIPILHDYNLLVPLMVLQVYVPPKQLEYTLKWLRAHYEDLSTEEQKAVKQIFSLNTTQDFSSIHNQTAYLAFMRQNYPELYEDFIIRTNALDFLNTAHRAVQSIGFQSNYEIDAKEMTVFNPSVEDFEVSSFNFQNFKRDFLEFIDAQLAHELINQPFQEILNTTFQHSANLEGIHSGLSQCKDIPNIHDILKLPESERLEQLSTHINLNALFKCVNPNLLGSNQPYYTGAEFLQLYSSTLKSLQKLPSLITIAALINNKSNRTTLISLKNDFTSLNEENFLKIFNPKAFRIFSEQMIQNMQIPSNSSLTKKKLHKFFKNSYDTIKTNYLYFTHKEIPILSVKRMHPFVAWLRGYFGDCSSENSFAVAMARKEEVYEIKNRVKSSQKLQPIGYLQFTRIEVDGEAALYVHTVSGAEVSQETVRLTLLALFDSLEKLEVKHILIPTLENIPHLINFPEVETVFKNLAQRGSRKALKYIDTEDRVSLASFTHGSLDSPSFNKYGIKIQKSHLDLDTVHSTNISDLKISSKDLFNQMSPKEALIIALELRNKESSQDALVEFLKTFQISKESFEALWKEIHNDSHKTVQEFHRHIQNLIQKMNISIDQEVLKHMPLLFRGHLLSPDAFIEPNKELAMEYISKFLLSYTNLEDVYNSLTPHFNELIQIPEFISLVRYLFRKNLKDMGRLLDSYELDGKSAYRTLIKLFQAGLPTSPFNIELQHLTTSIEDEDQHSIRKDGVYFRRQTFLGLLEKNSDKIFLEIMNHLEVMAESGNTMHGDDLAVVSSYLSDFMNRDTTTQKQIDRIYTFLTNSEFGLSFTHSLGDYKVDKLDVPKLLEILFKAGKPLWAAMLIHKNPWPQHPLAPHWVKALWNKRGQIPISTFFDGLKVNPSWLEVEGIEDLLNGLMESAREDINNEAAMVKILIKHPEKLDAKQMKWLSQVSTAGLAELVVSALPHSWISTRLSKKFPGLYKCQNFLEHNDGG